MSHLRLYFKNYETSTREIVVKFLILHSEAKFEVAEAVAYYEGQSKGLGIRFLSEAERAMRLIQASPNLAQRYKNTDCRRYNLRKFPFSIFYSEMEDVTWIIKNLSIGGKLSHFSAEREGNAGLESPNSARVLVLSQKML